MKVMVERGSVLDLAFRYPLFGVGAIILVIGMVSKINFLTYLGAGIAIIGAVRSRL
tara:strand:- start:447 stop:614 length:168 start_codon:yes stop_codon:yes gene_type:complete